MLGVVVGLALLALAFFGWSRYRTAQYHHRESAVLTRYKAEYNTCVADRFAVSRCAQQVFTACSADPFWQVQEPFSIGVGGGLDDASLRCRDGVTG
jgi:hypothetical protein